MQKERKFILEMLSAGKITPDEAEKLLDAQLDEKLTEATHSNKPLNKKFVRMFVREGDKTKVNINVPLALAEVALKLIPKEHLQLDGKIINLDEILQLIHEGSDGELVNIEATENDKSTFVKIYVD